MAKKNGKEDAPRTSVAAAPKPVYSFPSRSRCPRCGSTQTERYASSGRIQRRRCRVPTCRLRYKVTGTAV